MDEVGVKETDLQKLSRQLETLIGMSSPVVRCVKYPKMLLSSLRELDAMVEMEDIKRAILHQVHYLIINFANTELSLDALTKSKFDGHVLHTVIYGPPGVGKTKVGTILAKIWTSLGLTQTSPKPTAPANKESIGERLKEAFYLSQIIELQNSVVSHQNRLKKVNELASKHKDTTHRLRRKIMRLRLNRRSPRARHTRGSILSMLQDTQNSAPPSLSSWASQSAPSLLEQIPAPEPDPTKQLWNEALSQTRSVRLGLEEIIKESTVDPNEMEESNSVLATLGSPLFVRIGEAAQKKDQGSKSDQTEQPKSEPEERSERSDRSEPEEIPIVVVSRENFVAEFVGHTANKTENLLKKNIGKVVFIDEAYSLVTCERDNFGMEALTVLNRFMSEHSHEIIIIFAGYKDIMQKTIFTYQPGLRRRCGLVVEIKNYTPAGLSTIFQQQITKSGWKISPDLDLHKFFEVNLSKFPNFGGDTEKLAFNCKLAYATIKFGETFDQIVNGTHTTFDNVITKEIIETALKSLVDNDTNKEDHPSFYQSMYI